VVASSSGGTQAGLVAGAASLHLDSAIVGIAISERASSLMPRVHDLARLILQHLNIRAEVPEQAVIVEDAYLGKGYAVMGAAEQEAIALVGRTEGLVVDPVYTGRAMAGLIGLAKEGRWRGEDSVLFWHTGGTGALFAYADQFREPFIPLR